ncbi:MAG: hypothetical protein Q9218_003923, partial [Villophora microphyllina]
MPPEFSIHTINEAEVPQWLPGENLAAAAFLSMTLLLVLEINIQIHHVFTKRKGVYFWAMQAGSLGCAVDAVGLLTRYLIPGSDRVWPLYTMMTSVSWAIYTVSQLVVLYSRLHLVSQNASAQL